MAPIVIRAAMISASDRAALATTVDGPAVLTCLIGDTTGTNCHMCFSFRWLDARHSEQVLLR